MPSDDISKKAPAQVSSVSCWNAKSAEEMVHDVELEPHVTSTVTSVEQAALYAVISSARQYAVMMSLTIQVVAVS